MSQRYPEFKASPETFCKIVECEEFIEKYPPYRESWIRQWEILTRLKITEVWLDFAPLSFVWRGSEMTGGLIFHGPPTFSVNLDKVYGWSIHT